MAPYSLAEYLVSLMLMGITSAHSAVIRSEVLYGRHIRVDSALWTGIRIGRTVPTLGLHPT